MDYRDDREVSGREPLGDLVEGAVRRFSTSIAIAGALIALAIYARPGPPRYQALATPEGIVRIDTRSGTIIGCEGGRCMTLLRRGQRLAPNPNVLRYESKTEAEAVPPPAQKALPAPDATPAPAPPANPSTAPAPQAEPATNGQ